MVVLCVVVWAGHATPRFERNSAASMEGSACSWVEEISGFHGGIYAQLEGGTRRSGRLPWMARTRGAVGRWGAQIRNGFHGGWGALIRGGFLGFSFHGRVDATGQQERRGEGERDGARRSGVASMDAVETFLAWESRLHRHRERWGQGGGRLHHS
jgi:hypothetical protein|uniref:Uncharacterized protein n=1 Tax=Zea mays TaxID=4577 RepID=A0A804LYW4_MAIZE